MKYKEALEKIARVNAMDYEYQAWAKKALAQPEQEQQIETLKRCLFQMQETAKDLVEQAKSLPPPQRTWVGLDLEEQSAMWDRAEKRQAYQGVPALAALIQEVEAKLKEKNA